MLTPWLIRLNERLTDYTKGLEPVSDDDDYRPALYLVAAWKVLGLLTRNKQNRNINLNKEKLPMKNPV